MFTAATNAVNVRYTAAQRQPGLPGDFRADPTG
jgi:hypothetical protein